MHVDGGISSYYCLLCDAADADDDATAATDDDAVCGYIFRFWQKKTLA